MSKGVLVHEWLERTGGAERVFDAMVDTFSDADILCLWNDAGDRYPGRRVTETWLARTPLRRHKASALPMMPNTWRNIDGADYDWALVSSHLFAHHVSFRREPSHYRKFVYVHSPARYLWNPDVDKRGHGILPRLVSPALRRLDRKRAGEAWALAANSHFVRDRIRDSWERDAVVIHPPVDVRRIQAVDHWGDELTPTDAAILGRMPTEFLLGAARFVPYKRLDQVIAVGEATGLPVVLAGGGPERQALLDKASHAGVPVHVVDRPSDQLLYALYQASVAYCFPAVEDFGIMPVEAMAAGARVIASHEGGVKESVVDGITGSLCDFSDPAAIRRAVDAVSRMSPIDSCLRATRFDTLAFEQGMRNWVENDQQLAYKSEETPCYSASTNSQGLPAIPSQRTPLAPAAMVSDPTVAGAGR